VGFCDWLSIYQRHGSGLPRVADGAVIRIDRHGEVETTTLKKSRIEGSHETSIFVRCDGETVWFDGNVSKFGRPDNVFGYSFQQCLQLVNGQLSRLGLPSFTDGDSYVTNFKGEPRTVWTGAIVTRLDLTQNFSTGSKDDAYQFMRFLNGQQASRLKTGTYGDGETVDFGRGSRYAYLKAYLKGPELRRHSKASAIANDDFGIQRSEYLDRVATCAIGAGVAARTGTFSYVRALLKAAAIDGEFSIDCSCALLVRIDDFRGLPLPVAVA
jgi:II/X family phage/plasmid replication protein